MLLGEIFVWLIGVFVFFAILYQVIQSAIDQSKMARNIQDIRDMLHQRKNERAEAVKQASALANESIIFEECPGCGRKVKRDERICPECGLTLIDS
ncbi:zinc ribbon domain-containing protein [Paenibacillus sp. MSJ-34]|uniref:zinc ribbon domain-containing protein n=1 Tax=Paenibacillus sp. MSJ-34 TaxID=2841529 RepID=UPI001C122DC3|nr:zinc ribbon domain-containing protein [Paenibacillus sp. MSJ-34]MBU5443586.1 zinc ribbon domain-containing protein [Paenibacillus sp. MSJ-34]